MGLFAVKSFSVKSVIKISLMYITEFILLFGLVNIMQMHRLHILNMKFIIF